MTRPTALTALVLAASALGFAMPAAAAERAAGGTAAPVTIPAPDAGGKPARETHYCVIYRITGSILPHRTCHTRSQWLDQGFDPLAK